MSTEFEFENGLLIKYLGKKESVIVPSETVEIGRHAFSRCESLRSIIIPKSVKAIREGAFFRCKNLEHIELPDSIAVLERFSFRSCTNLQEISLPEKIEMIGVGAFKCCSSLCRVELPKNLKVLGGGAFAWCSNLANMDIPDGVQKIGEFVFAGCEKLIEIQLPDSIDFIGRNAFAGCTNIIVKLPKSWKALDYKQIEMVGYQKIISIPASVLSFDQEYAFMHSVEGFLADEDSLTYKAIDGVLFTRDGTALVAYPPNKANKQYFVPNGVKTIKKWAFNQCRNLRKIEFPPSLIEIESKAIRYCYDLSSILLSDSVQRLYDDSIDCCAKLNTIFCSDKSVLPENYKIYAARKQSQVTELIKSGKMQLIPRPSGEKRKLYLINNLCYRKHSIDTLLKTARIDYKTISEKEWYEQIGDSEYMQTGRNIWLHVWDDSPFRGYYFQKALKENIIPAKYSVFAEVNDTWHINSWRQLHEDDVNKIFGPMYLDTTGCVDENKLGLHTFFVDTESGEGEKDLLTTVQLLCKYDIKCLF